MLTTTSSPDLLGIILRWPNCPFGSARLVLSCGTDSVVCLWRATSARPSALSLLDSRWLDSSGGLGSTRGQARGGTALPFGSPLLPARCSVPRRLRARQTVWCGSTRSTRSRATAKALLDVIPVRPSECLAGFMLQLLLELLRCLGLRLRVV